MNADAILADLGLSLGTSTRSEVLTIWRAADEGGTIQAADMLRLLAGSPELHATCGIRQALICAGRTKDNDEPNER